MTIEEYNATSAAQLRQEIADHLHLAEHVWAMIIHTLDNAPRDDVLVWRPSLQVCLVLLGRLATDLQCVCQLASQGYYDQACTVAASIFEIAHTVHYVAYDDERAQDWIEHRKPKRSYKSAQALVEETARRLAPEVAATLAKAEMKTYAQLCWAKHSNPVVMGFRPSSEWTTKGVVRVGADVSERAVNAIWFALQHSARLGILALHVLQDSHYACPAAQGRLVECQALYLQLDARGKERWGTDDPFEGFW